MQHGAAVRNRSEFVNLVTPRGQVEVARQQRRGLHRGSGWEWSWVARRNGKVEWCEASRAREAIRRATLLPGGKPPAWLMSAAVEAEQGILSKAAASVADANASDTTP